MATRQKIKPLSINAEVVRVQAATEAARKRASKKALRESLKPEATKPEPEPEPTLVDQIARAFDHVAGYLTSAAVDAEALGQEFEAYVLSQVPSTEPKGLSSATYSMRALREASEHYVVGKNGNPHCGDEIAKIFADLPRDKTVNILLKALKLDVNPYTHLNPGQQSMNLRNKARGAIKNGFITIEDVLSAAQSA